MAKVNIEYNVPICLRDIFQQLDVIVIIKKYKYLYIYIKYRYIKFYILCTKLDAQNSTFDSSSSASMSNGVQDCAQCETHEASTATKANRKE